MSPPSPKLALTYGTFNPGIMLSGHLTTRISALCICRRERGANPAPPPPPGYSPVSVVPLHISAVNAICIMKAQPPVISNRNLVLRCLILLQDMLRFLLLLFSALV